MEEKKNIASVPYIVYESAMARNERTFKKMWGALILLILLLVGSNVGWLIYESQFETIEESVVIEAEQDASNGTNNIYGGDYYYGEAESEDYQDCEEESEEEFTDTEDLSDL